MKITTILFDLDGTLLPMDYDLFIYTYFKELTKFLERYGYDPEQLKNAVWNGTMRMIKNTGEKSNEKVFWEYFCGVFGEKAIEDEKYFAEFYEKEFDRIQKICGFNEEAPALVRDLKKMGYTVALATNPLFPTIATQKRMAWAGLLPEDFSLFTTYENINYCKPNPDYYRSVAEKLGVLPEECLMVGNDAEDDLSAREAGMMVYLMPEFLVNKKNVDISGVPQGGFAELRKFIENL
ncbi:MAG: HAD family hydrolase [Christensenellaceae bacterium]|nr:HAD family hydrolase [Christensenellaceae bacterium]